MDLKEALSREAFAGGIRAHVDRLENEIYELHRKKEELEAKILKLENTAKEHLREKKKYRDFMRSSKRIVDALKDEGLI